MKNSGVIFCFVLSFLMTSLTGAPLRADTEAQEQVKKNAFLQIIATLFGGQAGSPGSRNEQGRGGGQDGRGSFERRYSALDYSETSEDYKGNSDLARARLNCPGDSSFKWLYAAQKPPACVQSTANLDFVQLLDRSFQKCVAAGARSAGIRGTWNGTFSGNVMHKGIQGDSRHQKTASLHNVGRAVDIAAIEVNGQMMDFAEASRQARSGVAGKEYRFFKAFRDCWSQEAKNSSQSCRQSGYVTSAGYFGSLGWDDKNHQGHMHISMPTCDGRFKMVEETATDRLWAFLKVFRPSAAFATGPDQPEEIRLNLSSKGRLVGRATFTGEPVDSPVSIVMKVRCPGVKEIKVLEESLSVCDYVSVIQKKENGKIILTYKESKFNEKDGTFGCGAEIPKEYADPCVK